MAVLDDICCQYRVHSDNMSDKHYVIGVQEDIESISHFLPDEDAKNGLKYCYASLAMMYVREKNIYQAVRCLWFHGGWVIILKRVFNKIVKVFYGI